MFTRVTVSVLYRIGISPWAGPSKEERYARVLAVLKTNEHITENDKVRMVRSWRNALRTAEKNVADSRFLLDAVATPPSSWLTTRVKKDEEERDSIKEALDIVKPDWNKRRATREKKDVLSTLNDINLL